jgi:DNA invertase Pin-like site-specific DNA recombinase
MRRSSYRLPEKLPTTATGSCLHRDTRVLDGYVRVSYVGQRGGARFISARQQEAQIRGYAAAHRWSVGEVFVELNASGRQEQRPELHRMLGRVSTGDSDGVIVTRLDRLSRSVTHALRILQLLENEGASLISIEDGLNTETAFGKALATVLLALAELEVSRLAESTRIARVRAIERGVHHSAKPPTGYARQPGGRLTPNPSEAVLVISAFERRAAGATYAEIADFWTSAGLRTRADRSWTAKSVHKTLQNPVYVGEAFAADARNTCAHAPLVRRGLWLGALAASTQARAQAYGTTLLGGIVRCGGCCHVLAKNESFSDRNRRPGRLRYRCRRHHQGGPCIAPAAAAALVLDRYVIESFLRELDDHREPRRMLERSLAAAEDTLAQAEAHARSHPGWRSAYTDADGCVTELRAEVLSLWRQLKLLELPRARQLRRRWSHLTRDRQRAIIATALEAVILTSRTSRGEPEALLLFAGARRDWIPSGNTREAPRPFDPSLLDWHTAAGGDSGSWGKHLPFASAQPA